MNMTSTTDVQPWLKLVQDLVAYLPHQEASKKLVEFLVQSTHATGGGVVSKNQEEQVWEVHPPSFHPDEKFFSIFKIHLEEVFTTNQPFFGRDPVQSFHPILNRHGQTSWVLCLLRESQDASPFGQEEKEMVQIFLPLLKRVMDQNNYHDLPSTGAQNKRYFGLFCGNSKKMRTVYRAIEKVADTETTVTILGASGTGKELVARALHSYNSQRAKQPLIDVNCAAIPKELMESEFFGHEKGAFTGATQLRKGKFELAEGGTLFLDEIGELSIDLQAKLLRAVQEKIIWRVGGQRPIPVNVRIVAATQQDLEKKITTGHFRSDLYYRLSVFPIHLPSLSERRKDIIPLAKHFLQELAPKIEGFHPEVLTYFQEYHWPGNVRELKHYIERLILFHEGDGPLGSESLFSEKTSCFPALPPLGSPLVKTLDEAIKNTVCLALSKNDFNKSRTAKELDIFRDRLDRLIHKYSLQPA